jgi:protein SCO1/2
MSDPSAPVPAPDPFRPSAPLDPFRPPAPEGDTFEVASDGSKRRPARDAPGARAGQRATRLVGGALLAILAVVAVALFALVALTPKPVVPAASQAEVDPVVLAVDNPAVKPAPPIELTDERGQPFSLTSLRGSPVLVFFGYTHCPDVCPATVGILDAALAKAGPGPRVVFVSIDPERDDVAAMAAYLKYFPKSYTGLSGTPVQIRQTADAWGVQYAKQINTTGAYGMAHTADVFLVDAQGRIRTRFLFGTPAAPIATALTTLLAETPVAAATPVPATPAATPSASSGGSTAAASAAPVATAAPGSGLQALVVSSEVWAGGPDPVILTINDAGGRQLDGKTPVDVTVIGAGSVAAGSPVRAVAVQPWGEQTVYFVATVTIPSAGGWQLALSTPTGSTGVVAVTALDQGPITPLGAPAPNIHTPTLADVNGVVRAVTTQPQPDLRLSQTSTSDSRAAGRPYVIVIDSARFRVSPLCGKALVMVRYLIDRWQDSVDFIHLEPFVYTIITEEPVLTGDISSPTINQWAQAYGLGPGARNAKTVPWAFVVDGKGIVRAKYQGIIGSADLDVIISLIENNGVISN